MPAQLTQLAGVFPIIGNIALKFLLPPFGAGFWGGGLFATPMPMPEASVDEDDGFVFRQNNVRFAGQGGHVLAEAVASPVQHRAHHHLRFSVFAFDRTHVCAAFLWSQAIHNQSVALCGRKSKV